MPITVREDEDESGGYALVDLGALASSPLPRLSIRRRDTEPRHLGPHDWQPEIAWLSPLSAESIGGRTVVRYGPDVVDRIPDEIEVEIVEEGGRSFGAVQWPYVTPAPAGGGATIKSAPKHEPDPAPLPIPQPASPAPAEPPDRPVEPPSLPADGTAASGQISTLVAPLPAPSPGLPAPSRGSGRSVAAILVLLLLAGGAGAAWLYRDRLSSPVAPSQPESRPDPAEFTRRYATLLQRRAPATDLLAFGAEAMASGQGAMAFRAFEEADPAASEEAAWQLARFYDPRVTTGPARAAAAPNAPWAAYYHALWKGRSTRHTDELRGLCELNLDGTTRERMRALCQA